MKVNLVKSHLIKPLESFAILLSTGHSQTTVQIATQMDGPSGLYHAGQTGSFRVSISSFYNDVTYLVYLY